MFILIVQGPQVFQEYGKRLQNRHTSYSKKEFSFNQKKNTTIRRKTQLVNQKILVLQTSPKNR